MSARTFSRCPHCGSLVGQTSAPLTRKQAAIFRFVADYIDAEGYAPSFEEIAGHFGYASLATVHEHLTSLERKGWIRRSYGGSRAIEVLVPVGSAAPEAVPV